MGERLEINLDDIFKTLPNKQLLTISEVANFLNLDKRTVYRWYPDVLNGTNLNGSIRIYRVCVIELVTINNGKKMSDEDIAVIEKKCKTATKMQPKRKSWAKNW